MKTSLISVIEGRWVALLGSLRTHLQVKGEKK